MDIAKVDKNFVLANVAEKDVKWRNALEKPFGLFGVRFEEESGFYVRMPRSVSKEVSEGVHFLATHTSGGRLRFSTDSEYVAIQCVAPNNGVMSHIPIVGQNGFSVYENGVCIGMVTPSYNTLKDSGAEMSFDGIKYFRTKGKKEVEIYFPLYNGVKSLYIGLQERCQVETGAAYEKDGFVLFYGSSITQGGCASRPGNDYVAHLSRWMNTDVVNLGFSGNGCGERVMAEYMAGLNPSVYVLDYAYNSSPEQLEERHYALYETLRTAHPETPILFITNPDFEYDTVGVGRRNVVRSTWLRAKRQGDKNVAFIDGEKLFGKFDRDSCTVDTCHPNDLGFYRMAQKIYPALKKWLDK
jgi:lysophospholipase L1-like esterase